MNRQPDEETQMALYVGIDLHANHSVVVLDDQDRVVYHQRLSNCLEQILHQLAPSHASIEGVVVESTYNWYWLVDRLLEAGYRVHLANTAAIQPYDGLHYTDDQSDARRLAHLLRLGVLPEGYIYPKEERAVRDLLRKRNQLVRQKTANLLNIQNLMARNTGTSISGNRIKQLQAEDLERLVPEPALALAIRSNLTVMHCLEPQIDILERAVQDRVDVRPAFTRLLTVNGIGDILALTSMLETGDIGRFVTVGDFASYCRCVGSHKVSNGKRKGQGNTKNGNR
jgi:transposase